MPIVLTMMSRIKRQNNSTTNDHIIGSGRPLNDAAQILMTDKFRLFV